MDITDTKQRYIDAFVRFPEGSDIEGAKRQFLKQGFEVEICREDETKLQVRTHGIDVSCIGDTAREYGADTRFIGIIEYLGDDAEGDAFLAGALVQP